MPSSRLPVVFVALASLGLAACEDTGGPCEEYVDYMCDCHLDASECAELETVYEEPDADLQDECAISLDDQQEEDEETGGGCEDTGA